MKKILVSYDIIETITKEIEVDDKTYDLLMENDVDTFDEIEDKVISEDNVGFDYQEESFIIESVEDDGIYMCY